MRGFKKDLLWATQARAWSGMTGQTRLASVTTHMILSLSGAVIACDIRVRVTYPVMNICKLSAPVQAPSTTTSLVNTIKAPCPTLNDGCCKPRVHKPNA